MNLYYCYTRRPNCVFFNSSIDMSNISARSDSVAGRLIVIDISPLSTIETSSSNVTLIGLSICGMIYIEQGVL